MALDFRFTGPDINKYSTQSMAVRIWQDESGKSPEWYLERIVVKPCFSNSADKIFVFLCNEWIDIELGSGMIDRIRDSSK